MDRLAAVQLSAALPIGDFLVLIDKLRALPLFYHPEQYNHKIIAAYYCAIKLDGCATLPRVKSQRGRRIPSLVMNFLALD